MSSQKQRDPDTDFGFHAKIPRIVRTGYKNLIPLQKWLYTCLKDLCGDHGTCYRTIKVLAEETGLSTGLISESIPLLHQVGLIHAEKKKRSANSTKAVWHITIVDIWEANALMHPTKRSRGEHSSAPSENIHRVNENVHHVNEPPDEPPREYSPGEPECSHSETEGLSSLSNINEGLPGEEKQGEGASTPPSSSPSESSFPVEEKKPVSVKQRIAEIHTLYAKFIGFTPTWTEDDRQGAVLLSQAGQSDQDILMVLTSIRDDPDDFDMKKLTLMLVAKRFNGRLLAVRTGRKPGKNGRPTSSSSSPPASFEPDKEATKRNLEKQRQRNRERGLVPTPVGGT